MGLAIAIAAVVAVVAGFLATRLSGIGSIALWIVAGVSLAYALYVLWTVFAFLFLTWLLRDYF